MPRITETADRRKPPLSRRNFLGAMAAVAVESLFPPLQLRADPNWTAVQTPFRIAGNLHYVGSRDLASFLITTPDGHILLNSNLAVSPPQIKASVEKLGFRFKDIRILLISHAHYDHCAGSAQIKKETGAKYMVMDADVRDVESGGKANFQFGNQKSMLYPAEKVDRILHDGDQVRLGNVSLVAHKTAGHTMGCTTWTMPIQNELFTKAVSAKAGDRSGGSTTYQTVIVGSASVLESYDLIRSPKYPEMAADYARTFRVLESLSCDIFLGSHGSFYDMLSKYARLQAGDHAAFYDPAGYRAFVKGSKQAFEQTLAQQKAKSHTGS